jgi:hypothetical protein
MEQDMEYLAQTPPSLLGGLHLRHGLGRAFSAGIRLQAGSYNIWTIAMAGLRPALGLLFRGGLELIRVSFPKNPHKQ